MSDFLSNLAARATTPPAEIKPRPVSLFEPQPLIGEPRPPESLADIAAPPEEIVLETRSQPTPFSQPHIDPQPVRGEPTHAGPPMINQDDLVAPLRPPRSPQPVSEMEPAELRFRPERRQAAEPQIEPLIKRAAAAAFEPPRQPEPADAAARPANPSASLINPAPTPVQRPSHKPTEQIVDEPDPRRLIEAAIVHQPLPAVTTLSPAPPIKSISPQPPRTEPSPPKPADQPLNQRAAVEQRANEATFPRSDVPTFGRSDALSPINQRILAVPHARPRETSIAPPAPTIQVTIGRIEVRATQSPVPSPQRAPAAPPVMSLEDYLKQRNGGRDR